MNECINNEITIQQDCEKRCGEGGPVSGGLWSHSNQFYRNKSIDINGTWHERRTGISGVYDHKKKKKKKK